MTIRPIADNDYTAVDQQKDGRWSLRNFETGEPADSLTFATEDEALAYYYCRRRVVGECHDPRHASPCPHYEGEPCTACLDECDPRYFKAAIR